MTGHKATGCPYSMEEAQRRFGRRMYEVCIDIHNLLVGHPPSQCFTNKLIGLRRIEVLRTSRIDLTIPPSDEIPFDANFQSSPSRSTSSSSSDSPSRGNCSVVGKRERPKSSSEDEGPRKNRILWERRNSHPIAPISTSTAKDGNQGEGQQNRKLNDTEEHKQRKEGGYVGQKRKPYCSMVNQPESKRANVNNTA